MKYLCNGVLNQKHLIFLNLLNYLTSICTYPKDFHFIEKRITENNALNAKIFYKKYFILKFELESFKLYSSYSKY